MAFGANQIWDVRTTGSDSNGGGFNPANANFAADLTTDANTGNTDSPVVSSASYNFAAGDVGHWLYVKSGTNWTPGWYQIASVASNKATLTASVGSAYLMVNNNPVGLNTAAGVATVGTPTNGTWGIDYSQSDAAPVAFTDLVINAGVNTSFTSAAFPVGKNFVGNTINVTGGTGFTVQRIEVVSTSGTTGTADKSLGTLGSTGGTGNLGGALATPGQAGGLKIAGNDIFIKSGTYTLSNTTPNTAGGPVSDSTGGASASNFGCWVGWSTIRTTNSVDSTRPTISAGAQTTITLMAFTTNYSCARNIILDGNNGASLTGLSYNSNYAFFDRIKAQNCTVRGIYNNGGTVGNVYHRCEVTGCSGTSAFDGTTVCIVVDCEAYGNTIHGFNGNITTVFIRCISSNNTGASTLGFRQVGKAFNCVAYGNGSHGFDFSANVNVSLFENCIAEANGGRGYNTDQITAALLMNCAGYNNTSGDYSTTNVTLVEGFISQSAGSFFTDAAAGDFSLNNTAGRGALLRAAGFPGLMPRGTSTGYLDIGAIQHADPAGGGGGCVPVSFNTII